MYDEKQIQKSHGEAVSRRSEWDSLFREIGLNFLPRHQDFFHERTRRGTNRAAHLYDNSGMQALRRVSDLLVGRLLPMNGEWCRFAVPTEVYEGLPQQVQHELDIFLDRWTKVLQSHLENSNFRATMKALAKDWLGIGYCAVMPVDVPTIINGQLDFHHAPANRVWLQGASDTAWAGAYWMRNMFVRDGKREFPDYPKWGERDDEEEVSVIYFFIPHKGYNQTGAFIDGEIENGFLFNDASLPDYDRSIVTATYGVSGGETYGLGLAGELLTESQMLNKTRENHYRASAIKINPMFLAHKNIPAIDLVARPGARIPGDLGYDSGRRTPRATAGGRRRPEPVIRQYE